MTRGFVTKADDVSSEARLTRIAVPNVKRSRHRIPTFRLASMRAFLYHGQLILDVADWSVRYDGVV